MSRETKWVIAAAVVFLATDAFTAIGAGDWLAAAILPGAAPLGTALVLRARDQRMASDLFIGAAMLASIVLL